MARPTPEELASSGVLGDVFGDPQDALGPVLSGRNPDGTPYGLPVGSESHGYAQLTFGSGGEEKSLVVPDGATHVLITPSAAARIRDDGTDATLTGGYPISAGVEWDYDGDKIDAVSIFSTAAIDLWFYA